MSCAWFPGQRVEVAPAIQLTRNRLQVMPRGMLLAHRLTAPVLVTLGLGAFAACGSDDKDTESPTAGTGGSTGGAKSTPTGGVAPTTGGVTNTGGKAATGGTTGGTTTGGATTGGASAGMGGAGGLAGGAP